MILDDKRPYPCRNIHPVQTDFFRLDPVDYAAAEQIGKVTGIFHSHPFGPAQPSMIDMAMIEKTGMPWHIVGWQGDYTVTKPSGWKAPYEGRPFCFGVFDCFTLVQDWLRDEMGVHLPRADAEDEFWIRDEDWFSDWLAERVASGRFEAIKDKFQRGDVLFFNIRSNVVNHAAVWLGDGRILHQLNSGLSTTHIYGGYWDRAFHTALRPL